MILFRHHRENLDWDEIIDLHKTRRNCRAEYEIGFPRLFTLKNLVFSFFSRFISVAWWQDFTTQTIGCFFLPSFSKQNIFVKYQICQSRQNSWYTYKYFYWKWFNNFNFVDMVLANSKSDTIISRFESQKSSFTL